jgi:hypothetical protein
MNEESHALVEKRKEEIGTEIVDSLESKYLIQISSLRSWKLHFHEGEIYWELVGLYEKEKNFSALEGLANFFREARTGHERRVRDVSNFYIPFLIILLAFSLITIFLRGMTPSLGLFLALLLVCTGTMIVLLADEMGSNQKALVYSLMHEYCCLVILGKEKKKAVVLDDLLRGLLRK